MKTIAFYLFIFSLLLAACSSAPITAQPTQTPPPAATPTPAPTEAFRNIEMRLIPAPSLADNLLGEKPEREILVYLPPSYGNPSRRFPVVYYLPGFGDPSLMGFRLPESMDALIQEHKVQEMMVVVINGTNRVGGSFYTNSPVTGNWEDFVVQDVVTYIDANFRTLAKAESRGISGHSMGGFGALQIARDHPEVFNLVYSLSPGLFNEQGLANSQIFRNESLIRSFIKYEEGFQGLSAEEATQRMLSAPDRFALAYAYAFAPNPQKAPPYYDYPFRLVDGKPARDEEIWQRWSDGFGGLAAQAEDDKAQWLQLKGIVVEYGDYDEYAWIPEGCIYLGERFEAAGIPHTLLAYPGSHQSLLGTRIRDFMFPYFSTMLVFE